MKLTFAATTRSETICSGHLSGITKRVAEHCGADADAIIAKIQELGAVAFAFELQSESVGAYLVTQEVRGRSPWFEVQRSVIVTPAETIDVKDSAEALAICKERSVFNGNPFGVTKEEGGKRRRVDADGNLYTCGTAPGFGFSDDVIAKTVPVIAFFKSRVLSATLF